MILRTETRKNYRIWFLHTSRISSCGISQGNIISVNWLVCYRFFHKIPLLGTVEEKSVIFSLFFYKYFLWTCTQTWVITVNWQYRKMVRIFFFLYVSENFEYELKIVYFIIYIFIIHIILINIHIIKYSKIMILNLEHLDKNKDKRLEGWIIVYFRGRETYPKNMSSLCYKSRHCAYIIYRVKNLVF